jgi:hypothetical protein
LKSKVNGLTDIVIETVKKIVGKKELLESLKKMATSDFNSKDLIRWNEIYFEKKTLDESLKKKLDKSLKLRTDLEELNKIIGIINENIQKIYQNQNRLRENIKSLEKMSTSDLIKRYLRDMDKEEDDLKAIKIELEGREKDRNLLLKELKEINLQLSLETEAILENMKTNA